MPLLRLQERLYQAPILHPFDVYPALIFPSNLMVIGLVYVDLCCDIPRMLVDGCVGHGVPPGMGTIPFFRLT